MNLFDVSGEWTILTPFPVPAAAEDLARCIAALRKRDGLGEYTPAILDAAGPAPGDEAPIIVLNMEDSSNERGGYSWRLGHNRVEIYGDSRRGLCNGIYSFLAALGFSWPGPVEELLPPAPARPERAGLGPAGPGIYPLKNPGVYVRSNPSPENRRRLVIPPETPGREIPALGRWAARNRVDALVFSLRDKRFRGVRKAAGGRLAAESEKTWGLIIERGGWDLSSLVPRRYFFLKRDLFRMEGGTRKGDHHFCPTNPETIRFVRQRIAALLEQPATAGLTADRPTAIKPTAGLTADRPMTRRIYHLWPDRGAEHLWCACPACRAFNPREQIRLAVNSAAAILAEKDPEALVSCRGEEENPAEQLPGGSEITLRPNIFALKTVNPPDSGEPEEGPLLYIYEQSAIREL